MDLSVNYLLDLEHSITKDIFKRCNYPWDVLPLIKTIIIDLGKNLSDDFEQIQENVWVGKGTKIEKTVLIKGPAIIGHETELRQCAFIRENVIIGNNVVIGNSSEIKNSVIFNKAQVPHFNYVGDSIMGYKSHVGAGVILSNLKSNGTKVKVKNEDKIIETGLKKFGAVLGDFAEIGCNSVLNPGTVIGRNSIVYPLTSVRGCVPENCILKNNGEIVKIQ